MISIRDLSGAAIIVAATTFVIGASAQEKPSQQSTITNTGKGSLTATGKVVGPDSEPQPGVPVEVVGPQGTTTAFTDANGAWWLYNLEPGTYRVKPAVPGTTQAPAHFTVTNPSLIGGLFGAQTNQTYYATEMKIDMDWKSFLKEPRT